MKLRLDQALVDRGLAENRSRAQRLILAGKVRINGQIAGKPGQTLREGNVLELVAAEKYVSRGGAKLEHGLDHFKISPAGMRVLDLGASTGGFTDCLLQRGAARVWAVDVGHGQLAWTLRQDPRVVVRERTNARHLTPDFFAPEGDGFDLVVADCSFISLRRILPPVPPLLRKGGRVLALVKPQFEAGREEADRGAGVILDPEVHKRVLRELEEFVCGHLAPLVWTGVTESPLLGPAGNREFLALLELSSH
ncbi:MAG: TlyA family RNA methyltransferase [Pedosphaera sp.]|nr:TlyA family RNA methyltransferase [Pedosphaera sp.]